jgi:hypothetical protein
MAGSETRFVKQEVSHFHGEHKEHETDESTVRSVFIGYVSLVLLHRRHHKVYLGVCQVFILLCILNIETKTFLARFGYVSITSTLSQEVFW